MTTSAVLAQISGHRCSHVVLGIRLFVSPFPVRPFHTSEIKLLDMFGIQLARRLIGGCLSSSVAYPPAPEFEFPFRREVLMCFVFLWEWRGLVKKTSEVLTLSPITTMDFSKKNRPV